MIKVKPREISEAYFTGEVEVAPRYDRLPAVYSVTEVESREKSPGLSGYFTGEIEIANCMFIIELY